MSIVTIKGDNSPAGILRHWERKTKPECAREILRCWNEIERLKQKYDSCHAELLAIHKITASVATEGESVEGDALTVRRVRYMAQHINGDAQ